MLFVMKNYSMYFQGPSSWREAWLVIFTFTDVERSGILKEVRKKKCSHVSFKNNIHLGVMEILERVFPCSKKNGRLNSCQLARKQDQGGGGEVEKVQL